jgi:hypothetical protein
LNELNNVISPVSQTGESDDPSFTWNEPKDPQALPQPQVEAIMNNSE